MKQQVIDTIAHQVISRIREEFYMLPKSKTLSQASREEIVNLVIGFIAEKQQVDVNEMKQISRKRVLAFSRHMVCYLCRRIFGEDITASLVGQQLNGRDHTTVLHGFRTIENFMDVDPNVRAKMNAIESEFRERYSEILKTYVKQ